MKAYDLPAMAVPMPTLDLASRPTREEAMASMKRVGSLNETDLAIARFRGKTPWERHPDDELIIVLDGQVEITLLTEPATTQVTLTTACMVVIPKNTWHRSWAAGSVTLLAGTSATGSSDSMADDPRKGAS